MSREIDALVAEKVMGWILHGISPSGVGVVCSPREWEGELPAYSTDIAAAWQVVEKMRGRKYDLDLISVDGKFRCAFWKYDKCCGKVVGKNAATVIAQSALSCLGYMSAALKAVTQEK